MASRRRLILADITQSNLRGPALISAIGAMNKPGTTSYDELASGFKKSSTKKNDKQIKK